MDETRAREILDGWTLQNSIVRPGIAMWEPRDGTEIKLSDYVFTADELEAIVWWMRNKSKENKE